jgi:N-acetylglucosaminyldiphosphoundecaprenol N-acetyl-beta-D-mannosaminyltransferase
MKNKMESINIQKNHFVLGIGVNDISLESAIEYIISYLKNPSNNSGYIVKPYVEFFTKTLEDPEIKHILNQSLLSLPDGVSINWAIYYKNQKKQDFHSLLESLLAIIIKPQRLHESLPNHSWGTNFTDELLKKAVTNNLKIYLVGSPKNGTISNTAKYLTAKYTGVEIIGYFEGKGKNQSPFNASMQNALLKELEKAKPDIILVGIGFPAQEKLIFDLSKKLQHGILIGEGGTFDYKIFGGKLAKAPVFMQGRGLEWLWRLILEPRRLRRQVSIPKFIWKVYRNRT